MEIIFMLLTDQTTVDSRVLFNQNCLHVLATQQTPCCAAYHKKKKCI